jgi:hypothetical protein
MEAKKPKPEEHGPPDVTVSVVAPRDPEPKNFTWAKTMRVGEAAALAAAAFGYEPGTPSFVNSEDEVLDRDKPLVAEGVRDGDRLELVDVGGGV